MRYFLIVFLMFSSKLIGQINLYNSSLTDTTESILYQGYDNYLKVEGLEQSNLLIVTKDQDTLRYHADAFHYYYPSKRGSDTLTILKNNVKISEKLFVIKHLRSPTIFLGNIRDSVVTKKQLLSNPGFTVSYEPQFAKSNFRVLNFKGFISYSKDRRFIIQPMHDTFRSKFNKIDLSAIERMKSGDILVIEYVDIICPSCGALRKETPYLRFKIKEP